MSGAGGGEAGGAGEGRRTAAAATCRRCGEPLVDGATRCPLCGAEVAAPAAPSAPAVALAPAAPLVPSVATAPLVPGRREAVWGFAAVSLGWVTGFGALFFGLAHGNNDAEMRSSGSLLESAATFALLCDLAAVILGVRSLRRREKGSPRGYAIAALTLGLLGLLGATALAALGLLMNACGSCSDPNYHGCDAWKGIGTAVAQ